MAWEPVAGSRALKDRATADFASNLSGVLDLFDALRAADLNKPPEPRPKWWDGYIKHPKSVHLRTTYGDEPSPRTRTMWACEQTREAVRSLLRAWDRVTAALLFTEQEQRMVTACRESLRNLDGILHEGQLRTRWRYGVIPAEWHLNEPLPEVWEPEGESPAERQARETIDRLEDEFLGSEGDARDALRQQLAEAGEALGEATRRRLEREAKKECDARKSGLVSREVREQRENDLEDWRSQVVRWRLGERDVRQLVEWLMEVPDDGKQALRSPSLHGHTSSLEQLVAAVQAAVQDPSRMRSLRQVVREAALHAHEQRSKRIAWEHDRQAWEELAHESRADLLRAGVHPADGEDYVTDDHLWDGEAGIEKRPIWVPPRLHRSHEPPEPDGGLVKRGPSHEGRPFLDDEVWLIAAACYDHHFRSARMELIDPWAADPDLDANPWPGPDSSVKLRDFLRRWFWFQRSEAKEELLSATEWGVVFQRFVSLSSVAIGNGLQNTADLPTHEPPGDADAGSEMPSVILRGYSQGPIVCGVEKGKLTDAQFDLLEALVGAGETGLSKDEMLRVRGGALGVYSRLRRDPDWARCLPLPGKPGVGYRVLGGEDRG